jgi:hypothetical protein
MTESYRRWRLPQLWEMVAADNAADAHLHLATLRRQQTALETQRDRLRTLRDQLAEAWPPEKSEAATAFVQRINDMIRAMSLTAVGAAEVRSRMSLVVAALDQARTELAPLVEQYQRTRNLPDQRVGEQARRLLDEHARRILMATDAAVAEPAAGLNVQLPTYEPFSMQADLVVPRDGGGASGGGSSGRFSRSEGGAPPGPRFDPPQPIGNLADSDFGLAAESVNSVRPGPTVGGSIIDGTGPIGGAAGSSLLGPGRVLGRIAHQNGNAVPGSPAANGAGMRGVIGGGGGGVRPAAITPGLGGAALRGSGGTGYRDASFDRHGSRRAPQEGQDESWTVQEGVPSVIDVPPSRAHDPGPGVIGIDR